jgi:cytochrome c oxidase subunit 3
LFWGTLNLGILLLSAIPNQLTKSAADRHDVSGVRLWIVISLVAEVIFALLRIMEFRSLNVWWDDNAYASLLWIVLGFHTTHVIADTIDSTVLAVLFFTTPIAGRRFSDASENALYWYFVIGTGILVYAVIYLVPRLW